jgi:methyl-accepting chemotaxis protein
MAEDRYIRTGGQKHMHGLAAFRKELKGTATDLKAQSTDREIHKLADSCLAAEESHATIFQSMVANLNTMQSTNKAFVETVGQVNQHLKQIINAIEHEESMLFTEGEYLPLNLNGFRKEVKDVIMINVETLMNIQDLMINGDIEKYQETKTKHENALSLKSKNIELILGTLKEDEYSPIWTKASTLMPKISELDRSMFEAWCQNEPLQIELQKTGAVVEDTAIKILSFAENARQADQLMQDANRVVNQADDSMTALTTSMEEISRASDEKRKDH